MRRPLSPHSSAASAVNQKDVAVIEDVPPPPTPSIHRRRRFLFPYGSHPIAMGRCRDVSFLVRCLTDGVFLSFFLLLQNETEEWLDSFESAANSSVWITSAAQGSPAGDAIFRVNDATCSFRIGFDRVFSFFLFFFGKSGSGIGWKTWWRGETRSVSGSLRTRRQQQQQQQQRRQQRPRNLEMLFPWRPSCSLLCVCVCVCVCVFCPCFAWWLDWNAAVARRHINRVAIDTQIRSIIESKEIELPVEDFRWPSTTEFCPPPPKKKKWNEIRAIHLRFYFGYPRPSASFFCCCCCCCSVF